MPEPDCDGPAMGCLKVFVIAGAILFWGIVLLACSRHILTHLRWECPPSHRATFAECEASR